MVNLSFISLLLSFHLSDLVLQAFDLDLLLSHFIVELGLVLFLQGAHTLKRPLLLFSDALLKLLALKLVEVLHLSELLLRARGLLIEL